MRKKGETSADIGRPSYLDSCAQKRRAGWAGFDVTSRTGDCDSDETGERNGIWKLRASGVGGQNGIPFACTWLLETWIIVPGEL
jgi:hypothetical protein